MMKYHFFACMLLSGTLLGTVSCGMEEIQETYTQVEVTEKNDDFKSKAEKLDVLWNNQEQAAVLESEKYSVSFEENEVFADKISERAAEHIDQYIREAVMLMNSMKGDQYQVLSCDYATREKERDHLESALSLEIYDTILEKTLAFEDYYWSGCVPGICADILLSLPGSGDFLLVLFWHKRWISCMELY